MPFIINNKRPHRIFYNGNLVKRVYMDDKLVFSFPQSRTYVITPNQEELNKINSSAGSSNYSPVFDVYPHAAGEVSGIFEAPIDGEYTLSMSSFSVDAIVEFQLYEGEKIVFKTHYATCYSIGEFLYRSWETRVSNDPLATMDMLVVGYQKVGSDTCDKICGFQTHFKASLGDIQTGHSIGAYKLLYAAPSGYGKYNAAWDYPKATLDNRKSIYGSRDDIIKVDEIKIERTGEFLKDHRL